MNGPINSDMLMLYVNEDMTLSRAEWKKRIHVAGTQKNWYKRFVVVVVVVL